jgi:hypothetical protein
MKESNIVRLVVNKLNKKMIGGPTMSRPCGNAKQPRKITKANNYWGFCKFPGPTCQSFSPFSILFLFLFLSTWSSTTVPRRHHSSSPALHRPVLPLPTHPVVACLSAPPPARWPTGRAQETAWTVVTAVGIGARPLVELSGVTHFPLIEESGGQQWSLAPPRGGCSGGAKNISSTSRFLRQRRLAYPR